MFLLFDEQLRLFVQKDLNYWKLVGSSRVGSLLSVVILFHRKQCQTFEVAALTSMSVLRDMTKSAKGMRNVSWMRQKITSSD